MNITMFSMTPLFPDQIMGGSQKNLKEIAKYMGSLGHKVTILCTKRKDTMRMFYWSKNTKVLPIFNFKQPYPNPYATAPYNIANAIYDLQRNLDASDRFYMHDCAFVFPYVYRNIPTVSSVQDVVYSETLQGAFLFQGDELIFPSRHTQDVYLNTVGRHFPDLNKRTRVIHTGFNWNFLQRVKPKKIVQYINVDPERNIIILHPHRPEENKGIWQTIAVVKNLVQVKGFTTIKVLVPKWLDTKLSPELSNYYTFLEKSIQKLGLSQNFYFHEWIPYNLMPEYFSLGRMTLCLGSYIETFGNVPYESLGCGTPAIIVKVGPHRDVLPDNYVHKVDFGDIETTTNIAQKIILSKESVSPKVISYMHDNFSYQVMTKKYAEAILNVHKRQELEYKYFPITQNTRYKLAPWCYWSNKGIYNDFRAGYTKSRNLIRLWTTFAQQSFSIVQAQKIGVRQNIIIEELMSGNIVTLSI